MGPTATVPFLYKTFDLPLWFKNLLYTLDSYLKEAHLMEPVHLLFMGNKKCVM